MQYTEFKILCLERSCKVWHAGLEYSGNKTTTSDGDSCLSWVDTDVNPYHFDGIETISDARNYCRNPGAIRDAPWCYVKHDTWKYCRIEFCGMWSAFILSLFLFLSFIFNLRHTI